MSPNLWVHPDHLKYVDQYIEDFSKPDNIEGRILSSIGDTDDRILRERLEAEGKWEEYLRWQNMDIDDSDERGVDYSDEYSGNDPNSYDGLDEWIENRQRKRKREQDARDMEIAMAALAALEDEYGE